MTAEELGITEIGLRYIDALIHNSPTQGYWRELSRTEVAEVETVKSASLEEVPLLLCQVTTQGARDWAIRRLKSQSVISNSQEAE